MVIYHGHDLHSIYDQDSKLLANLRKANKLTYRAMHPGNNKQSVNLALSLFHESTNDASIHTWWTMVNSRDRFCSNQLGNAVIDGDGKTDFFLSLPVVILKIISLMKNLHF